MVSSNWSILLLHLASGALASTSVRTPIVVKDSFNDSGIPWVGPEWTARDAETKQAIVWDELNREINTAQPWPVNLEFQPLFERSMFETFQPWTDMMPQGRPKVAHAQGVVAKVRFIPVNTDRHELSGLFRTGSDYGLIRYSDTFKPNEDEPRTLFSAALKFFRDGMHSGNTVLMVSTNARPSHNFFKEDFLSILDFPKNRCAQETISTKLATVDALFMGNSSLDLAQHHCDESVRAIYADDPIRQPFRLRMEHEPGVRDTFPDNFIMSPNEQILSHDISPGSRVAKVWCLLEPDDPLEVHCGDLVTTSEFIASIVGDQKLYFAHQVMKEDCEMRPEWEPFLPKWEGRVFDSLANYPGLEVHNLKAEELVMQESYQLDWECPFAYLFSPEF